MNASFAPIHEWMFLLIPLAALGLNVATNFLLLSWQPHRSIFKSVLLSTLIGVVGFAALAWLAHDGRTGPPSREWIARMGCGFLTYACWSYVFFHFVHIPVASVRIRILQDLIDHDGLTQEAILRGYNGAAILRTRLERLTRNGQIVRRGKVYVTGRPRLLHVARLFAFVKRLVTGGST
jgi:hypothetical protein